MAQEIDDELRFHLEMRRLDNEAEGMEPEEAGQKAMTKFGDVSLIHAECMAIKEEDWLRVALIKAKSAVGLVFAFCVVGIVCLVANAVFVRMPLTYQDGGAWVAMWWRYDDGDVDGNSSAQNFKTFQANQTQFSDLTAVRYVDMYVGAKDGPPRSITAKVVTPNYFEAHGVSMHLGRSFEGFSEERLNTSPAILSHAFWKERFGSNPHVIGKSIQVDGIEREIIGVASASFRMYYQTELFLPLVWGDLHSYTAPTVLVSGRLIAGASVEDVQQQLQLHTSYESKRDIWLRPVKEVYISFVKRKVFAYVIFAGLMLVLVCVHLSRSYASELMRFVRVESSLPSLAAVLRARLPLLLVAGASAVLAAHVLIRSLLPHLLSDFSHLYDVKVDAVLVAFNVLLIVSVSFLLCVIPWLIVRRAQSYQRRPTNEKQKHKLVFPAMRISTALEVALAFLLFVGGSMLAREVWLELKKAHGYNAENVLVVSMTTPHSLFSSLVEQKRFMLHVFQEIDQIPGVQSASLTSTLPGAESIVLNRFTKSAEEGSRQFAARSNFVGLDFLQTLEIPVLQGRYFQQEDMASSADVALVNKTFADLYWEGDSPVGQTIYVGRGAVPVQVIGVVNDVLAPEGKDKANPTMYHLYWQTYFEDVQLLVKADHTVENLPVAVRKAIRAVEEDIPVQHTNWLAALNSQRVSRLYKLFGLYGLLGLLGLYVAVSSVVNNVQRCLRFCAREVSLLREAGYSSMRIRLLIIWKTCLVVLPGVLLGAAGVVVLFEPFWDLFAVRPLDSALLVGISLLLIFILITQAFTSSRSSQDIDQQLALRYG